jgi:PhzF family phenazine biosynthesis protein
MSSFTFQQVDVFTSGALKGNPLAVVAGADALSDTQMQALANWTNLSETAFLLKPGAPEADYRVRIFTPQRELPFAGHPTLGSCHVWLALGGAPRGSDIVQECGVGLVRIRRDGAQLAFAAPPLRRSGAVEPELLAQSARGLRLAPTALRASQWIDNGPGWMAVMLATRAEVLALEPDFAALGDLKLGVIAPWDAQRDGTDAHFEVRALIAHGGVGYEDPVTGSLNAGLAQWLIGAGLAPASYVASQGTVLGRAGRVQVRERGADIWIGGQSVTVINGTLSV